MSILFIALCIVCIILFVWELVSALRRSAQPEWMMAFIWAVLAVICGYLGGWMPGR